MAKKKRTNSLKGRIQVDNKMLALARILRMSGKTYKEICAELTKQGFKNGVGNNYTTGLLTGIFKKTKNYEIPLSDDAKVSSDVLPEAVENFKNISEAKEESKMDVDCAINDVFKIFEHLMKIEAQMEGDEESSTVITAVEIRGLLSIVSQIAEHLGVEMES